MKSVSRIQAVLNKHKGRLAEFSMVAILLIISIQLVYNFDIFSHGSVQGEPRKVIEVDEAVLVGLVLFAGLLVCSLSEQRRESLRRTAAERRIRELAFQDVLTGLPNRQRFDETLKIATNAPPKAGEAHGVFLLDVNNFKSINAAFGTGVGDEVLVTVAQRLRESCGESDLVARLGADEFAIIAWNLSGPEAATNVALRLTYALKIPIDAGSTLHKIETAIGISLVSEEKVQASEVLRRATVALLKAKSEKLSNVRFFDDAMDHHVHERAAMEIKFRHALREGHIKPAFKPVHDLTTQKLLGFEARPQWIDAAEGSIPADRFIAIAEEAGLVGDLTNSLLRQACQTAAQWPASVWLSLDVIPSQMKDKDFPWRILEILKDTYFAPERLQLEIAESALVQNMDAAQTVLGILRRSGVKIALDHFGTGYSSLYHLRNFKLDKIKIDSSFVGAMTSEKESAAIVDALTSLGRGFGLTIAAEGINDLRQGVSLMGAGCEQGQGTLYGDALTQAETLALVAQIPDVKAVSPRFPMVG